MIEIQSTLSQQLPSQKQPINRFGKGRSRSMLFFCITSISIAMVVGCPNTGFAQNVECTDLSSIRNLNPGDAAGVRVDFEATVTYVDEMREFLFAQEGQDAIFVYRPDVAKVATNQRVRIRGRLAKGDLLPIVLDPVVTVIGDSKQPTPEMVSVIGIEHDCRFLKFEFESYFLLQKCLFQFPSFRDFQLLDFHPNFQ